VLCTEAAQRLHEVAEHRMPCEKSYTRCTGVRCCHCCCLVGPSAVEPWLAGWLAGRKDHIAKLRSQSAKFDRPA
jgi:hypothetical protein